MELLVEGGFKEDYSGHGVGGFYRCTQGPDESNLFPRPIIYRIGSRAYTVVGIVAILLCGYYGSS